MTPSPDKLAIHGGAPAKSTPFGTGPKHDLDEWRALKPIFQRGVVHMTRGPEVMELRKAFCRLFGMKHAVTVSSGTAALHTALAALRIGRGDEVITSPVTDMGTLLAIQQLNAVPVFADVDPLTLMVTARTVAARITRRTRAVVPVHLAGQACDARGIRRLTRKRGMAMVEDVAQSYLARQGNRLVGTIGDIGCWSLNESKHVGAGDGGVLLTNDPSLADRADLFADKCYDRTGTGRQPFFMPMNYRLNLLAAAVSLEQLKRVRHICSARNRLGRRLDRRLARIPGVAPRPVPEGDYATYWYAIFHVASRALGGVSADDFVKALQAEGVPAATCTRSSVLTWPVFSERPLDRHACGTHCPLYKGRVDYRPSAFPGLARAGRTAIRLSLSEFYTPSDIDDMARGIAKVAAFYRRGS